MKRLILIASVLAATLTANSRLAFSSPVADWPPARHGVSAELHRDSVALWSTTTAECFDAPSGGRLGSTATRQHVGEVATELRRRGYEVTGGGGVRAEEYIPGPAGRKGSAYPDITAIKNGRTLRINTIDTLSNGLTPTAREAANAAKIRQLIGNEHLLLIPKP